MITYVNEFAFNFIHLFVKRNEPEGLAIYWHATAVI